ncbi:MAG: colanic acid biosynthesis acetyltransferase WcaF [Rhodocyclaceae bacterium]
MTLQDNDPFTQASFSLGSRIRRGLWCLVEATLFRLSPRPLHVWRACLLRLFGAQLGKHVHVYPGATIWAPWNLQAGDFVGIADGVTLYNIAEIRIGSYCVVSQDAFLCTGSHDIDSKNFQLTSSPIVLEPYVWVCARAFVGPGVQLAEGCVLGAQGVLMYSVQQSWTVWSGNPAVLRRERERTIKDKR